MEYKDYYKILGINKNANEKEIKQAYRKLARKFHPDVNPGDKSCEQKFKEINEAYEVLGDKEKRAQYDRLGSYVQGGRIPDDIFSSFTGSARRPGGYSGGIHFDFGNLGGSFRTTSTGNISDFSDFFNMFFGGGMPSGGRQSRGQAHAQAHSINLEDFLGKNFQSATASNKRAPQVQEIPIELTLEEAVFGTNRLLHVEKETVCEKCRGAGAINTQVCNECRGAGKTKKPTKIEVKIPAGVRNGSKIRVENYHLVVKLLPHPFFEIRNGELYCEVPVTIPEAVLGAEIEIPTLKGTITTKIPPETQNGKTLRFAGLGLPEKGGKHGNLYAKIKVVIPKRIGSKEKKLFEELARLIRENPRSEILAKRWS